ncbi:MarR family winged helix-turn-helix transcriptional regulator [Allonocardiopsis opalescens]|uniref:DNA-binding MarR family transcriptional regulator n=1 Tax=Allonocardiopsis opalescens TaxID=1144618 RepID=A0A2T0Q2H7_9ACTN|nr:MarR family transcriptional regulator [Allonocardiopsis opalescens]PRX97996.1 DNA-binding MarR family transcriptional regulator [Allonocardiopsis opalescens]
MPPAGARGPRIELPSPLEERWQALRRLEAATHDALDRALQAEHGISASEYAALAALAYSDDGGHLRQQALADAIPLKQSSVSRLVARLERAGLTERFLCPTDRRGVYTQITARGRELVAQARPTHRAVLERALAAAATDPTLKPLAEQVRGD